ncbi:MAG: hypothetical protein AAF693_19345 [Bacteroidota bacterium]
MEDLLKRTWDMEKNQIPRSEIQEELITKSINMNSKHVINRIKKKLLLNIIATAVALISIIILFYDVRDVLVQTSNIINTVILLVSAYVSYMGYRIFRKGLNLSTNIKESLTQCYKSIKSVLLYQEVIGAITGFYVVSAFLVREITTGRFSGNNTNDLLIYFTAFVLAPVAAYLLMKITHYVDFKSYLDTLKENIRNIEK